MTTGVVLNQMYQQIEFVVEINKDLMYKKINIISYSWFYEWYYY